MGRVLPIRGSINNYHNHTMGAAQPPKIITQKNMYLVMERGSRGRKQFLQYRLHSIFYTLKIDMPALCMETQLGRWSRVIAGRAITGSLDSAPHTFQQRRHEMDCDLIGAKTQAQRRKRGVSGSCGQSGGSGEASWRQSLGFELTWIGLQAGAHRHKLPSLCRRGQRILLGGSSREKREAGREQMEKGHMPQRHIPVGSVTKFL